MKKFFGEFKKFITRGNVLDMAVGVIVGGAFTAIVNGLTKYILQPLINWIIFLISGSKGGIEGVYTFLVGDASDCIKGVTQAGKKKALRILDGEIKLSESQEIEYNEALKLIDVEAHPLFNELYETIEKNLMKCDRVLKLKLTNGNC